MKKLVCNICQKNNAKYYKSETFGKIALCQECIRREGGLKNAIANYEIGNMIFIGFN